MISFCSREFRAIKLIVFAVAGLKTNYPSFSLPALAQPIEQPVVLEKEETDQAIPNEESEVQIPEDEDLAALLQQSNEESDDFSLEEIGGAAGTVE